MLRFVRLPITFVLIVVGALALSVSPAFAQVSDEVVIGGEGVITIPMWVYTLGTGWFVPILVGIITKINAPSGVKIIVSLVLNAINGIIGSAVVLGGNAIFSIPTIVMAGLSLLTALATYAGIWKPLNTQAHLAPNAGIGPDSRTPGE